jgi:hypothetical protein
LVARKVIVGMSPEVFAPDQKVTRAQFITMLVKNFGLLDEEAEATFEDVNRNAWYYSAVATAYNKGLVKGRSATMFAPDSSITRAEMAVMMRNVIKVLKLDATPTLADSKFVDDELIPAFATDAVQLMYRIGLMKGHPGNFFSPNLRATRAEASVVIYKLFSIK